MTLKEQMQQRLAELGRDPKRSLGQNFLIGDHVVVAMIQEVDRLKPELIIEIGPGLGALTDRLRERQYRTILIELDKAIATYWAQKGENVIVADALQLDWQHEMMEKVKSVTPHFEKVFLLSNLPYQISSRLVIDLSTSAPWLPRMELMFQREVADRLRAAPRTEDYSFLSVVAQTHWAMERVVDASEEDFFPRPNVTSRVMSFLRRPESKNWDADFTAFVKQAFSQRRKFLTKAFSDKKRVTEALVNIGFNERTRAEEMGPSDLQSLYREVVKTGGWA